MTKCPQCGGRGRELKGDHYAAYERPCSCCAYAEQRMTKLESELSAREEIATVRLNRLERAEQRIAELESENERLLRLYIWRLRRGR